MSQQKIDCRKCADCGCDRGGVINLEEEPPVLRCFKCAKSAPVVASAAASIDRNRSRDRAHRRAA